MLQLQLDMDFGTLIHYTILSQGTLTVILQEVLMIGKAHRVMFSIWVQISSLGHLRNNPFSACLLHKQNR